MAAALLPLAAHAQSSFDAPPVPAGPSSPTASAVRGVQDNLDPMTSPAMPAGAAGVPAATFVAPSQTSVAATEPLGPPIVPTDAQPITGSEIVARVEDQVILASDVMWQVHRLIDTAEKTKNMKVPPDQRAAVERLYLEKMVTNLIDTKL
ncbi:MAG TPA: hypothetical protein VNC50_15030, partial [Planctomycetia bacterium]|nr:hypothetical protein [Planctomycetia bacterium]